ncbi:MAG: alpha/beta hydrolase, partial [Saprospiraceae bacterium]
MKNTFKLMLLVCYLGIQSLSAQKIIPLYQGSVPNNKENKGFIDTARVFKTSSGKEVHFLTRIIIPEVYVYLPAKNNTGGAVIICPGGGYGGLAIDHEGHDIAKKLAENGIAGIVLKNRVPNPAYVINKSIVPLQDAQRAIQL